MIAAVREQWGRSIAESGDDETAWYSGIALPCIRRERYRTPSPKIADGRSVMTYFAPFATMSESVMTGPKPTDCPEIDSLIEM
jgi:hypothetical protein